MTDGDTIFALSSGTVPAAIAVMRVSGPAAGMVLATLADELPAPRRASVRTLRATDGSVLDRALVLWMPGPKTATGEDLAELHLHGGRATVAAVAAALLEAGARLAQAGEFTRRALLNGVIDLAQAEGLADLLAAESEEERRVAIATTEGQLSRALHGWYAQLATLSAIVEAQLDHADEGDVPPDVAELRPGLYALAAEMRAALDWPTVERLRQGPTIVLSGPPNAGKSSLFNALIERDAAIVTPIAGTTRDVLDVAVMRQGRGYRLIDTAGINEATDPVEQIGVARARDIAARADMLLWLGDDPPESEGAVWINSRCDLPERQWREGTVLSVSAYVPATIEALWRMIADRNMHGIGGTFAFAEHQRQRVFEAWVALGTAMAREDLLMVAEELRVAMRALDAVLGRHAPEEMLDALFARFCVGK